MNNPIKPNNGAGSPPKNRVWELLKELAGKKGITEIAINSPTTVFVEKDARFFMLDVQLTKEDIRNFVQEVAKINYKECNAQNPILDGTLPDGSRINIICPPFVPVSPVITIRKYLNNITSFENVPGIFGLSSQWVALLRSLVLARMNVIISGGTGVGKTTFLNLLLQEIPPEERVITIEDTREIKVKLPNLISMEAGMHTHHSTLTTRDLVRNTLRMRPDRIIIGEVRSGEIFDLLQAMNTGHDGSMTSIHANSTGDCLRRISTLYLLAGYDVPLKAIKGQISSAINFIIQIGRNREGMRSVLEVAEITGMEGENILMQKIGGLEGSAVVGTGIVPSCSKRLIERGGLDKDFFSTNY